MKKMSLPLADQRNNKKMGQTPVRVNGASPGKKSARSLRIAQIAPLWHPIPPPEYGGTERVVHSLTEGLVEKGFQVTLFACGTSKTAAKLVSVYPRSLVTDHYPWTSIMYPLLNINEAFKRAQDFDIIHMHLNKGSDYIALPICRPVQEKVLFTLHFPYPSYHSPTKSITDKHAVFQEFNYLQYSSISNAQRRGGENLNWLGTVYNGIDSASYTYNQIPSDYFLWLGKFNLDKGTKLAILAAKKARAKLILAGKIDLLEEEDNRYFKEEIEPLIDNIQIRYVGEVGGQEKNDLLGHALALLNPIQWNEPFGLVMTEAMACGTPVIAFNCGAAAEIVSHQQTGYLVDSIDAMVEAMAKIGAIKRKQCRMRVEEKFTKEIMVEGYIKLYEKMLKR